MCCSDPYEIMEHEHKPEAPPLLMLAHETFEVHNSIYLNTCLCPMAAMASGLSSTLQTFPRGRAGGLRCFEIDPNRKKEVRSKKVH